MPQILTFATVRQMKADLEEISQGEADVSYLKQKVDNLSLQLSQQIEQNNSSTHDSSNQPMQTSNHQAKWYSISMASNT